MISQVHQDSASNRESRKANRGNAMHFTDLDVWQVAHSLTLNIYKWTKDFPNEEKFGLVSQMRRAAVSIESNIAEGFGRLHKKEKQQFYYTSRGSCFELETQILICKDTNLISSEQADEGKNLCERVRQMLNAMIRSNKSSAIRDS